MCKLYLCILYILNKVIEEHEILKVPQHFNDLIDSGFFSKRIILSDKAYDNIARQVDWQHRVVGIQVYQCDKNNNNTGHKQAADDSHVLNSSSEPGALSSFRLCSLALLSGVLPGPS